MEKGDKYIVGIGEVEYFEGDNGDNYPVARIKGFSSLMFDQRGLDKLERLHEFKPVEGKELYSCKFVVTDKGYATELTVGKIYELKNGKFRDDIDTLYPKWKEIYSFKDLEEYFERNYSNYNVKILEIKE